MSAHATASALSDPSQDDAASDDRPDSGSADTVQVIGSGPPEIRVLMVDDDGAYRALCQRFLKRDRSVRFDVTGAASAAEAIEQCTARSFDCLLIDYRLPDATGTEVLRQLADLVGESLPPAIILTALGGEAAATEAVRAGATDFLAKRNVSSESLGRALRNAAEQGRLLAYNREKRDDLKRANEELQRRSEEIQRFYHTVAHEVKTPLTAVREFLAIINDELIGPINEEQREILGYSLESCDQLVAHFNDLVSLTRLETGKLTVDRQPGSLDSVLARCLTAAAVNAEARQIELVDAMEQPLPQVLIDANRINQVLANLLNNAIKFTDNGGRVELFSHHDVEQGWLEVSVRDSGPGIDPDHLSSVFERLFQVNPNLHGENSGGLGLGLSIAQDIMQRHDSTIRVESEVGVGSTFSFRLQTVEGVSPPFSSEESADNKATESVVQAQQGSKPNAEVPGAKVLALAIQQQQADHKT